jgi:inner membrane transporter RhtA
VCATLGRTRRLSSALEEEVKPNRKAQAHTAAVHKPAAPLPGAARAVSRPAVAAPLLVIVVAFSFNMGSAIATHVIARVGVVETLWLRTAIGAAILVGLRPRSLRLPGRGQRWPIAALAVSLFAMNFSFYEAIAHAPLGIVVSIEFLGPLSVAVSGSRRPLDFLWIVLAAAGVITLAGPTGSIGVKGLLFALSAGFWWAIYLLMGKRAVSAVDPIRTTVLMLVGSAILISPLMAATGFSAGGSPAVMGMGVAVAVLSSAFPYFIELVALRLVRASVYGVLLSLEPGVAALCGFLVASQKLSGLEIVAIGAVVVAAAGASRREAQAEPVPPAP